MDNSQLLKIEYRGQLVLTTAQIADSYRCNTSNIRWHLKKNKTTFVEGVHYFRLTGKDLRNFKAYLDSVIKNHEDARPLFKQAAVLYIWTDEGATLLCQVINSQKAREALSLLKKHYFNVQPQNSGAIVYVFALSDDTIKTGVTADIAEQIKRVERETDLQVVNVFAVNATNALEAEKSIHTVSNFNDACKFIGNFVNPLSHSQKIDYLLKAAEITGDNSLREKLIGDVLKLIAD